MESKLTRSESNKKIAGVCAGLAQYLNIDVTLVRVAFVLLLFASGVGLLLYVAMAIIIPSDERVMQGISFDKNVDDAARSFKDSFEQVNDGQNGPKLVAGLMIAVGTLFLLQNFGISLSAMVPIMLIGLGAWLLINRGRE